MGEQVHPILVRVPEPLADALTSEAADRGCSRHALILDKLQHECPAEQPVEWNTNPVAVLVTDPEAPSIDALLPRTSFATHREQQ